MLATIRRMPTYRLIPLFAALLLGASVSHAQQTAPLQERMSAAEFKAAGLDKLSPQELQNLDNWLGAHAKVTKQVVTAEGKPVFYMPDQKRSKIDAHIVGHFSGWNGHNVLTLDNSQTWTQNGSDAPSCNASDNPMVKLKPSLFGAWLMYVDGCNGDAHVERTH